MIMIANWKSMADESQIDAWLSAYQSVPGVTQIVLCPWPYLKWIQKERERRGQDWILGAQEPGEVVTSPKTGVVGMDMLQDCGVQVVCVGHHESRTRLGLSHEAVRAATLRVMAAHMIPLVCVSGMSHEDDIAWLSSLPERLGTECWVAYEPTWAIGADTGAAPDLVAQQLAWLDESFQRRYTKEAGGVHWFYGGAVNANNLGSFVEIERLSGVLVGRASMRAGDWKEMLQCI